MSNKQSKQSVSPDMCTALRPLQDLNLICASFCPANQEVITYFLLKKST